MNLPVLSKDEGRPVLLVDGKPTLLFAGEAHNSSASSLTYMEEQVWPNVRGLHLNCLIVPVCWEFLEGGSKAGAAVVWPVEKRKQHLCPCLDEGGP